MIRAAKEEEMDLLNAKLYIEKITGALVTNKQLANALKMYESGISRKISTRTKLKLAQVKSLEEYFCIKLPEEINKNDTKDKNDNYDKLEEIITSVLNYLKNCEVPFVVTNEMKAKLITTVYRMVQYNAVEVNETLLENLLRLMDT